jgi:3-hydroxybutyryl-CoA dehydrogenase
MQFKKIAVFGAGTMGNGIAHVFAQNNFEVNLVDTEQKALDKAIQIISSNMDRQIKKSLITDADKTKFLTNIRTTTEIQSLPQDTDLIIEAIFENKEAKINLFNKLQIFFNNSIIASNTSSISITELSNHANPEKFIGMHFMNPVPVMELVEVINGYSTSKETIDRVIELIKYIKKTPVIVSDYPGFIANRILMPMINEAIFSLYENVASASDIDAVMKLGMNHPMGPLALADFIGLDVCLAIMEVLYNGFLDSKYRPCPLLKKMVAAGKLGRKSKEGFYKY